MRTLPLAVALLAAALAACGMGRPPGGIGPGMHGAPGDAPSVPSPAPGAPETEVVAGDFWFAPDTLRLVAGETVNLAVRNDGRLYHDLTIEALGLTIGVDAGARSRAALTIAEPGTYTFVCSVPGHAEAGMRGNLDVSLPAL